VKSTTSMASSWTVSGQRSIYRSIHPSIYLSVGSSDHKAPFCFLNHFCANRAGWVGVHCIVVW
jgi:hypothetical protein